MPAKYPVIMPILAPIHPPNEPKTAAPSIEISLVFKMHTSYVPNLAGGVGGRCAQPHKMAAYPSAPKPSTLERHAGNGG